MIRCRHDRGQSKNPDRFHPAWDRTPCELPTNALLFVTASLTLRRKETTSRKALPATLRAALPMSLYEVFRVAMQAGAKTPGRDSQTKATAL